MLLASALPVDILEQRAEVLEHLLVFWTWIVVIGLIYEYAYEWYTHWYGPPSPKIERAVLASPSYLGRIGTWQPIMLKPLSPVIAPTVIGLRKRLRFPVILERLGAILVVLGVVGEVYVEANIAPIQEQIRKSNAEVLSSAYHSAAEANLKAGKLQKQAEELKRANLELEEDLAPRIFKDQLNVAFRLNFFAGTHAYVLYLSDQECRRLAEQIVFVLKKAGWTIDNTGTVSLATVDFDVMVQDGVAVGAKGPPATALINELEASGLDPTVQPGDAKVGQSPVLVTVGMKPSPAQHKAGQKRKQRIAMLRPYPVVDGQRDFLRRPPWEKPSPKK
jgi:hypothetical protein